MTGICSHSTRKISVNDRLSIRSLKSGYKIEDDATGKSVRVDARGRWCSYRNAGKFYRRCLDGTVVSGAGVEVVPDESAHALIVDIQNQLKLWSERVVDAQLKLLLDTAAGYDAHYYGSLQRLYADNYPEAVPILPPDRYGDLVVQPARGCPNRGCTFCAFYRDKPFKVLSEKEIESHLTGIIELFGADLTGKDGLFLGSANAMALSQRRLMACLRQIEGKLGQFDRGIAAFADPDFSAKRTADDWQKLYEGGLRHLVVGLETGWGELRGQLGKAEDLSQVRQAVMDYKKARISVGLTILTGACPEESITENVVRTVEFVSSLSLDRSDTVYLSPLSGGNSCERIREKERSLLKKALAEHIDAKTVSYQMQRFRYFA